MFITNISSILISAVLFVGIGLCAWLGHWLGRQMSKNPVKSGTVEAAVLALLGLLLAFSFSASESRLDRRRDLIVQEANDIGTAWLRLDLLPPDTQPALRDLFRRYTDERIAIVTSLPDLDAAQTHQAQSIRLQGEIWPKAVEATNASTRSQPAMLLLPSINDMIDITTTRDIAARTHTPMLITTLIFAVALLSGLLAGVGMSESPRLDRMHVAILAAVVSITVYVILDLENPRSGLIRLDHADRAMELLRESMK